MPTGRREVTAAILDAAAELFAERGPTATSIRDIAARSHVNHGLVFRHLGSKEQLVGAVLDHLAGQLDALVRAEAPADRIDRAVDRHTRVVARAVLDGYPAGRLQSAFPNLARLVEEIGPNFDDPSAARLAAANVVALGLGWRLFEPFLRTALDLEAVPDEVVGESRSRAAAAMVALGAPRGGSSTDPEPRP